MSNAALKVCMIDDDEADIFLARRIFSQEAPHVSFVARSDAGAIYDDVDKLKVESAGRYRYPDLIFLDINMPKADGFAILRKIKAHEALRKVPTIIFTTSEDPENVEAAYAAGAAAYITKPYSVDDYSRVAQSLALFWGGAVKLPTRNF